ncbi:MAG: hypothetical protein K0R85_1208, partial [Devosia sp.]|nr:hypothetical protein [Devosia sp.]
MIMGQNHKTAARRRRPDRRFRQWRQPRLDACRQANQLACPRIHHMCLHRQQRQRLGQCTPYMTGTKHKDMRQRPIFRRHPFEQGFAQGGIGIAQLHPDTAAATLPDLGP